jgi:hypothetical protein
MLTLTSEMLDRIEVIRQAATTAIKSSTLPDELQIDLRQSLNQAIDTTVAAVLKANGTSTSTPVSNTNSTLQF